MSWGEGYMAQLKRDVEAMRKKRAAERATQSGTSDVDRLEALKRRIVEWFNSRPREAHPEYYFMSDLKHLIGATPQDLGTALHELGWSRRRIWRSGAPFRQTWHPPDDWQHRDIASQ